MDMVTIRSPLPEMYSAYSIQIVAIPPFPISLTAQSMIYPEPTTYEIVRMSPEKSIVTIIGIVREVRFLLLF